MPANLLKRWIENLKRLAPAARCECRSKLGAVSPASAPGIRWRPSFELLEDRTTPTLGLTASTPMVVATSYFDSAVYAFDAATGTLLQTLVAPNSQSTLEQPSGMAVGPDGNLYFSSQTNNSIVEYNLSTRSLSTFISSAVLDPIASNNGDASFSPGGLTFGPDGDLYVSLNGGQSATSGGAVVRFGIADNGGQLSFSGTNAVIATGLIQPTGLTFGIGGDRTSLYASDSGMGTVVRIAGATGSSPSTSTFIAAGSGGLNYPSGLTWDTTNDDLYVTDLGATSPYQGQVLVYNSSGAFQEVFTQPSSSLQYQFPSGALFLPNGNLLTADLGPTFPMSDGGPGTSGAISEFDSNGMFDQVFSASAFPANSSTGVTNFSPSQLVLDNTAPPSGSTIVLSPDTINIAYNQTIAASGGTGTVTLMVSNVQNAIPGLNVPTSGTGSLAIAGIPTVTGTETFTVTATDSSNDTTTTHYSIAVNPALALTPSLPADTVNSAYSQTIAASGGTGDVTLTVSNIQNPIAGLVVPTSGTGNLAIAGTPTATGTETFTVTATDSVGATTVTNYTIAVNPAPVSTPAPVPNPAPVSATFAPSGEVLDVVGPNGSLVQYGAGVAPIVIATSGVQSAVAGFGSNGEILDVVSQTGALVQYGVGVAPIVIATSGVQSTSVGFGPNGEVLDVVYQNGALVQLAAGVAPIVIATSGVQSASLGFGPNGEVLDVVYQNGALVQLATGVAPIVIATSGVQSASLGFGPNGEVLDVVFQNGTLIQLNTAGTPPVSIGGVQSASVGFNSAGEVLELVEVNGELVQVDSNGVHPLGDLT